MGDLGYLYSEKEYCHKQFIIGVSLLDYQTGTLTAEVLVVQLCLFPEVYQFYYAESYISNKDYS